MMEYQTKLTPDRADRAWVWKNFQTKLPLDPVVVSIFNGEITAVIRCTADGEGGGTNFFWSKNSKLWWEEHAGEWMDVFARFCFGELGWEYIETSCPAKHTKMQELHKAITYRSFDKNIYEKEPDIRKHAVTGEDMVFWTTYKKDHYANKGWNEE